MKTIIIAQASLVILVASIFTLFMVPVSFAMKNGNNGGSSLSSTSCDDETEMIPTSMFTRLNRNQKGSVSGFEIHLSNTDGDCTMMIFSSNASESSFDLSDHQNSHDDIIAMR